MNRRCLSQRLSICAALFFVVLTYGCVGPTVRTYSGDKLSKSEVGVIKGWYFCAPPVIMWVDVYRIDGRVWKATKVEVLPGWHELAIRIHWVDYPYDHDAFLTVEFNVEAGHEYRIRMPDPIRLKGRVDIIDDTTGATIVSRFY